MGGGVALGLKKKWSSIENPYKENCNLGECSFQKVDKDIFVANMVAQKGLISKNNPKPIKYWALAKCMLQVGKWAITNNCNIIAPKFGSLRAKGNWSFIEELIEEIWLDSGINVTIYEYIE